MNKNVLLVTVAATALIAGASMASAQTMNTEQPKASAPMKSDSEKAGQSAQSPKKDADKAQATGQVPKAEDTKKAPDSKPQTTGQAPREGQAQGQQGQPQTQTPTQTQGQGQQQQPGQTPAQRSQKEQTQQGQTPQQGQGQQGAQQKSGGSVTFTTEQRTHIRTTVLQGSNAPRATNVNFSINVGTVVPTSVRVVAAPQVIVDVHPEWRGLMYFIVNDQIIIVDRNHKIVAVLDV